MEKGRRGSFCKQTSNAPFIQRSRSSKISLDSLHTYTTHPQFVRAQQAMLQRLEAALHSAFLCAPCSYCYRFSAQFQVCILCLGSLSQSLASSALVSSSLWPALLLHSCRRHNRLPEAQKLRVFICLHVCVVMGTNPSLPFVTRSNSK